MKVVGIVGSPRAESNTAYFMKVTLEVLEKQGIQTKFISLRNKKIQPCTGCYQCIEAKRCTVKDDFHDIFDQMVEADGLLFGSPVYHASITADLKALLDRAGFSGRWAVNEMKEKTENYNWQKGTVFSGKVAAPITVARRAGHDFAFAQLLMWMTVNDLTVIGSNYWNVGMAGKGGAVDAHEDTEGVSIMQHLAQNMAYVIKQLKK
ncbi:MAG: flavodoxin family protein [Clostridiaceae bacterium]|nr:flavodoxin family protein [Clostridiaceae bacterium]